MLLQRCSIIKIVRAGKTRVHSLMYPSMPLDQSQDLFSLPKSRTPTALASYHYGSKTLMVGLPAYLEVMFKSFLISLLQYSKPSGHGPTLCLVSRRPKVRHLLLQSVHRSRFYLICIILSQTIPQHQSSIRFLMPYSSFRTQPLKRVSCTQSLIMAIGLRVSKSTFSPESADHCKETSGSLVPDTADTNKTTPYTPGTPSVDDAAVQASDWIHT